MMRLISLSDRNSPVFPVLSLLLSLFLFISTTIRQLLKQIIRNKIYSCISTLMTYFSSTDQTEISTNIDEYFQLLLEMTKIDNGHYLQLCTLCPKSTMKEAWGSSK